MGVILLPACVDLFAWGGLLAYYVTHKEEVLTTHSQKAFMISLIGFIVIVFCLTESPHILTQTIFRLGSGLLALGMIIYCLYGSNKFLDIVFSNRILIYIGKISYGLYLLHLLVLDSFFIKVYQKLIGTQPRFAFVLCARFTLLIFICSLSWYLFERPINNLKDKLAAY
jgi:peptidoglycan/LPS O-acetylase OafA/YrhL